MSTRLPKLPTVVYVLTNVTSKEVAVATVNDSEAFCLYRDCPGVYHLEIFVSGNRIAFLAAKAGGRDETSTVANVAQKA